nr:RNA-directed DNA polymerase, eukaryota, nucleotide-binding alpha-beta plait domain protein [Tanacetum cinerariifolium]
YSKVADAYIPLKTSKAGKKFAFVRFLNVENLERLIKNICTIWMGRFRLHANPVRFQREFRAPNTQPTKGIMGAVKNSFAYVLKSNTYYAPYVSSPAIVMDDSCLVEKDLSYSLIGKIKDINALSNLYVILADEGFDNITLSEDRLVWISVEGLPMITWNKNALAKIVSQWGSLSDVEDVFDASWPFKKVCVVTKPHTIINDKIKIIVKGKIYWIRVKELKAWTPDFNNEFYVSSSSDEDSVDGEDINLQQMKDLDHVSESSCMKQNVEFENHDNINKHGTQSVDPFGIYEILNKKKDQENLKEYLSGEGPIYPPGFTPNVGSDDVIGSDQHNANLHTNKEGFSSERSGNIRPFKLKSGGSILEVMEDLVEIGRTMGYNMEGCSKNIEAIVGFQRDSQEYFTHMIDSWEGECVILEDFNEVRSEHERFGSKMSKLDRFLVDEGLLMRFPSLSALCLDRHLFDHRAIIMRDFVVDYGPSPFRLFHSWFNKNGFDKLVEESWKNTSIVEANNIYLLRRKFQALKAAIKTWYKDNKQHSNESRQSIQLRISELEKLFDKGKSNDVLVNERTSLLKDIHDINARHSLDMA